MFLLPTLSLLFPPLAPSLASLSGLLPLLLKSLLNSLFSLIFLITFEPLAIILAYFHPLRHCRRPASAPTFFVVFSSFCSFSCRGLAQGLMVSLSSFLLLLDRLPLFSPPQSLLLFLLLSLACLQLAVFPIS